MSNKVADLIRRARKARGLSIKAVSEEMSKRGIPVAGKTIYGWESGNRQPDADTFMVLCDVLGIQSFPETETPPDPEGPRDEEVQDFISMVSQLTDEHKRFLAVVLQALIELEQGQLGGIPGKAGKTE